jgi:hypothetical protein
VLDDRDVSSPRPNTIEGSERPELGLVLQIDEAARGALLSVLNDEGLLGPSIMSLSASLAIPNLAQIPAHMVRAFGSEARALAARVSYCVESPYWDGMVLQPPSEEIGMLLKAPDWYVLRLLEAGFEAYVPTHGSQLVGRDATPNLQRLKMRLARVLAGAGGRYTIHDDFTVGEVEDPLVHDEVLAPALRILEAPGMDRIERDFRSGLDGLRRGGRAGFTQAINEAAAAVEGMLVVVRQRRGVGDGEPTTSGVSFNVLRDAAVVPNHLRSVIMAPAEIRNKEGGHSSQTTPRAADLHSARAAVYCAAVAITYLHSRLEL